MSKKILVVGSLNMDQSVHVDNMPIAGETIHGRDLSFSHGGKGANQACAAGKLGGCVAMLGCIGNDNFGEVQQKSLSSDGVDVTKLKISPSAATGTALIYVNSQGNNSIVIVAGANNECDVDYLQQNDNLFQESDYILLQMEIPVKSVYYSVERGYELGKAVVLNPAPAPDEIPADILKKLYCITPNESELQRLTGCGTDSIEELIKGAKKLVDLGVKNVVVTIGKQGVLFVTQQSAIICPTTDDKPVDTTAAGDTFNAAYLVALSEGKSVEEALCFGNLASSVTVTRVGAQIAIPTRKEVEERRESYNPDIQTINF